MEKERKVYEAPELRVHQTIRTQIICKSGSGTGTEGDLSRRSWFDDEEE